MNQFNKRVRTNTGNIFNINYESVTSNDNNGGGGGGGGGGSSVLVVNNLTTNDPDAALSAAQGVVLKGLVDGINADISGVDTRLDLVESQTAAILDSINLIDTTVSGIDTRLGVVEYNLQELQDSFDFNINQSVKTTATPTFANVSVGGTNFTTLESNTNTNTTNIANNTSNIATLNTTVSGHTTSINSINTSLTNNINQAVKTTSTPTFAGAVIGGVTFSTLNTTVTGHTTSIGTINTTLTNNINQAVKTTSSPSFAEVTVGGVTVSSINNLTQTNEFEITGLQSAVSSNTSAISTLNTNVSSLSSRVTAVENILRDNRLYSKMFLQVRKDSGGTLHLDAYTNIGITITCSVDVGDTFSGVIYFTNDGTFDWPTGNGTGGTQLTYQYRFITNIGNFGSLPGIMLSLENNQVFSIRPYLGNTISDWASTLANDTAIGFDIFIRRVGVY